MILILYKGYTYQIAYILTKSVEILNKEDCTNPLGICSIRHQPILLEFKKIYRGI
jgi:hypothetical protein